MRLYLSYGTEDAPEGFEKKRDDIADGSVQEVQANHYLEKVFDLQSFMEYLYRVMAPGAKAVMTSGYYGCAEAYNSPLVQRALSEQSLNWCSKTWREAAKWTDCETNIDFDIAVAVANDPALNLRSDEVQTFWRTSYLNCIRGIVFTLTKK